MTRRKATDCLAFCFISENYTKHLISPSDSGAGTTFHPDTESRNNDAAYSAELPGDKKYRYEWIDDAGVSADVVFSF